MIQRNVFQKRDGDLRHQYDIVVIGGGHAGAEAAWAASRMGAHVALVTMQHDAIGRMSCNPAIGGLGKGQMVCEIDALGGLMGLAIDEAGIQFRMLNRSKGPAVWAPRAQADRQTYPRAVQRFLACARSCDILEGAVEEILAVDLPTAQREPENATTLSNPLGSAGRSKRVVGVALRDGRRLRARAVIVTTGTFLRGLMHCGPRKTEGGRVGESSAVGLSGSLSALGFSLGRLKTGTPPRVHRDSIDYDACERQRGDEFPTPFSLMTDAILQPQIDCWVTWTNEGVHALIRDNLHRAPMYSGQISSTGPRYCPSIEDKVMRFADKTQHQVFLEPEGYEDERVYCNGISTSLPADVQEAFVRRVKGLERAKILQHGYAVEYDYVPTYQIRTSLETKIVAGLFLAGQINGTSGYEEAAGQGLLAGVNAVRRLREEEPFVLGRDEAYLGVMVDDLVTRPPSEPYRMFTSRAEYRLLLRADNADRRLTPIGRKLGLAGDRRWARFERRREDIEAINRICHNCDINNTQGGTPDAWIRRPSANLATLAERLARAEGRFFGVDALEQVLTDAKYSGYITRQARQIERFRKLERLAIPEGIHYGCMTGLRLEAREQLARVTPGTLGQAARIPGINPADITALWIHITGRLASQRTNVPPSTEKTRKLAPTP